LTAIRSFNNSPDRDAETTAARAFKNRWARS
jgi:hypothetical protein